MLIEEAKRRIRNWIYAAEGVQFASRFERTKRFRKIPQVSISFRDGLYFVVSEGETIAVARKSRLRLQIENGIPKRRASLMEEYCVPDGLIRPGDFVIDCGANIGEFSVICARAGAKVLAFEPDIAEFRALSKNSADLEITPIHAALWKDLGEMQFFDANDTGDSSLIEPGSTSGSYTVKTIRLDDFESLPNSSIRLIKLEAEGAEPEILDGMQNTLQKTEYITVDMGPERGVSAANTVRECTDFLYSSGFRMCDFFHGRCSALFERQ